MAPGSILQVKSLEFRECKEVATEWDTGGDLCQMEVVGAGGMAGPHFVGCNCSFGNRIISPLA